MGSPLLRSDDSPDLVLVTPDPIEPATVFQSVASPRSGATVVFVGTVRDHAPGRDGVTHLEYEAYREVVESKIVEIVAEAREQWPLIGATVVHRVGTLAVGDISVAVAASSAHRADAFSAARYLIDQVKARAPIWKKEHWPGGAEWVREDLHHPHPEQ